MKLPKPMVPAVRYAKPSGDDDGLVPALSLPLLMTRIFADHAYDPFAADDRTLGAYFPYR